MLNHIKEPKNKIVETIDSDLINEEVLEIAVNKLNQKYESLNEDDKYLFKKLSVVPFIKQTSCDSGVSAVGKSNFLASFLTSGFVYPQQVFCLYL